MASCANHPSRIALERCEVCDKPLCAYCLYYTEDGQRLCAEHATEARERGLAIEEPALYADQLIGAQADAGRKRKHDEIDDEGLYVGNSTDMLGMLGLLVGVISLSACCGGFYCLPFAAFVLSLIALLNAKKAYDPARTRRYGAIGLLVSGVWVLLLAACIVLFLLPFRAANWSTVVTGVPVTIPAYSIPTATPAPTGTPTGAADSDANRAAAWHVPPDALRDDLRTAPFDATLGAAPDDDPAQEPQTRGTQ